MRDRERERERQTDRQTDREPERERERELMQVTKVYGLHQTEQTSCPRQVSREYCLQARV